MWRNAGNHSQETKAVKKALQRAGLTVASIHHGRGTAWSWLHVTLMESAPTLHAKIVEGEIVSLTRQEWIGRGDFEPCMVGCAGCDRLRDVECKARQIIRDTTGRSGEYDGNTLLSVLPAPTPVLAPAAAGIEVAS